MIDNPLIAVHAFTRCMLTSLSVDEVLLPRNISTGLPLRVEMAPFHLKLVNSILFAFM